MLLLSFFGHATTYYVKADGGSNTSGLSDATAWNYATLNSKRLAPGDVVLLKRGDIFFSALKTYSGSSSKVIRFGAYGNGANPVISGFKTLTSWTHYSGAIYFADLSAFKLTTLNLVVLRGQARGMGRYPNSGYLSYTGHTGNSSIKGAAIGSLPFNATGAEAVVRKVRWILDRHPVKNHSGRTLRLGTSSPYGGSLSYQPVDNNGFFIQNHLSTLDREGEWYYDPATKRLYMVLPHASSAVDVSVLDRLVYLSSKSNISFSDVDFEGSNLHSISMHSTNNIMFERCHFDQHGQTAIYGNRVSNITISGGSIKNCLNSGIWVEWGGQNVKVEGVAVYNIGAIAGAGRSGDGAQQGIAVSGNNTTIRNCIVKNIGYNGIQFNGSNAKIENNYVDTFCTVKDDGGGIYTFENDGVTVSNRVVRNNIVLNAIGAYAGAESYTYEAYGKAAGVYLDGYSNHTTVSDNVLAHGTWAGVFVNNNSRNQIVDNLIFNHNAAICLTASRAGGIRNMTITGNQCIAKAASQKTISIRMFDADNPSAMGTFNGNYYARPINDNNTIHCDFLQPGGAGTRYYTLEQWKSNFRIDASSKKSPLTFKDNIEGNLRFEYNAGDEAKTVSLDGDYIDVAGTPYKRSLTLPAFSGVVLLRGKSDEHDEKTGQTITFTAPKNRTVGDEPFSLNAVATSGLAVSYRVISGPATITGNTVTLTGVGTVTIEAFQPGNSDFLAASVKRSFSVSETPQAAATQSINFATLPYMIYGAAPFQLKASSSAGLPVSYRVVSGPAKVSGDVLTVNGVGKVTVEALQEGNATIAAAESVRRSFTVGKASQQITFEQIADRCLDEGSFRLEASASSGLPVNFVVVSGPASIRANMVTIRGTGTVIVEASQKGNAHYKAAYSPRRSFSILAPAKTNKTMLTTRKELGGEKTLDVAAEKATIFVFPNPVQKSGNVRLLVPQSTGGYIHVFDQGGRLVKQLGYFKLEKGQPSVIHLNVQELPKGTYFLRFSDGKTAVSQAFQVL